MFLHATVSSFLHFWCCIPACGESYKETPARFCRILLAIKYTEESGQIDTGEEHRRIYDHVFDTPPGEQMLIDFGEVTLGRKSSIHFICLLLRYSRFVSSETYGEVITTHVFEDFCTEQELKLWVCNKHDPESKGYDKKSVM